MPTSARSRASALPSSGSGWPSTRIVPESIGSSRLIARHSVDLPDPDGPITTTTSPGSTVEVDVLQHVQVAEVLVDLLHLEQGSTCRHPFGPPTVMVRCPICNHAAPRSVPTPRGTVIQRSPRPGARTVTTSRRGGPARASPRRAGRDDRVAAASIASTRALGDSRPWRARARAKASPSARAPPRAGAGRRAASATNRPVKLLAQVGGQHRPGPGDLAGPLAGERGRGRPHPLRVEPAGDRPAADQRPDQVRLLAGEPFPVHRRADPAWVAAAIAFQLDRPARRHAAAMAFQLDRPARRHAAAMASSSAASSASGG